MKYSKKMINYYNYNDYAIKFLGKVWMFYIKSNINISFEMYLKNTYEF